MSADAKATFAIELKDESSGAANAAANSLGELKKAIDNDVKALREMQGALRNLKGGTGAAAQQATKLKDAITAQKAAIAQAQSRYLSMGGTFEATKEKTASFANGLATLGKELAASGGPVAGFGAQLASLSPLLASPLVLIGALITGLAALAAAYISTAVAIGRYAVASADARRSEALRLEGFRTLRTEFGRVTATANEMQGAIDRASDLTGIGRSEAEGYARSLARAGLSGEALAQALEGTALAAAVQGDRGAARFRAMAISAHLTGRSVSDLAETYRRRLGPIARRAMLSLDNQQRRLGLSLEALFRGVRIEGFLSAIDNITRGFSQTTATGRALKTILESLFNPLFDASESLGPIFRRFFQGLVIGALLFTIVLLRVRNALRNAFGGTELLSNTNAMWAALALGVAISGSLAVSLLIAAAAMTVLVVAGALVVGTFLAVGAAVGAALYELASFAYTLGGAFRSGGFAGLGAALIDGLVGGISSGYPRVDAVVTGLANQTAESFRRALGIHSPSRVFAEFGTNISEGVASGVNSSAGLAESAVGNMVAPPSSAAAGATAGNSFNIAELTVMLPPGGTREQAESFLEQLAQAFEGVSIEIGAT